MSTRSASAIGKTTKKLLSERIRARSKELDAWYQEHASAAPPPFYCSIDLRDSGHKIAPVDSNLYPAGFNNICPEDIRAASPVIRAQLESWARGRGSHAPRRVLILPERHTSNANYIENLYFLHHILENAGYQVELGWYGEMPEGTSGDHVRLRSASGKELEARPIRIDAGVVSTGAFVPDFILLNNDFSAGYPEPLDAVTQPILPSHALGWHTRRKSDHFEHYNRLAAEFASIAGIDPWIIQVDTEAVDGVNFNEEKGVEQVAQAVDRILSRSREAYARHQVAEDPFVFVKNNSGTYGMGIMVAKSADELRHMNRRTKNKMSVGKNHRAIESVVVQEGIPTATLVDRLAAEPVIYLFGCELIGGFLRTNTERGTEENLNSPGMVFRKLCMSDLRRPPEDDEPGGEPLLERVYGSIARISALATGVELARRIG
jgi:glutamate--cysteine ligase